jgi:hypothetical protein
MRRAAARDLLDRLAAPSFGLPLAAGALIMPFTLHAAVWAAFTGDAAAHLGELDGWIRFASPYTVLAHLALAACALRFGARLRDGLSPREVVDRGCGAVLIAAMAGCIPGILLLGIPPLVVAVTAASFVPLTFYLAAKRMAAERAVLVSYG